MPMETTSKALMRCGFGRKRAITSEKTGARTRNTTTMLIGACSNATMEVARRQSGRTLGPSSDPLQCHHSREVPCMLQLDASQHDFVWHVLECTMPVLEDSPQSNELAFRAPDGREFERIQAPPGSHHATQKPMIPSTKSFFVRLTLVSKWPQVVRMIVHPSPPSD